MKQNSNCSLWEITKTCLSSSSWFSEFAGKIDTCQWQVSFNSYKPRTMEWRQEEIWESESILGYIPASCFRKEIYDLIILNLKGREGLKMSYALTSLLLYKLWPECLRWFPTKTCDSRNGMCWKEAPLSRCSWREWFLCDRLRIQQFNCLQELEPCRAVLFRHLLTTLSHCGFPKPWCALQLKLE